MPAERPQAIGAHTSTCRRYTFLFKLLLILLCLLPAITSAPLHAQNNSYHEPELKAALVYGLIRHIQWSQSQSQSDEPFRIGFVSGPLAQDSAFFLNLKAASSTIKLHDQSVEVEFIPASQVAGERYKVIIVANSASDHVTSIANKVRRTSTLLITDNSNAKRDLMINIVKADDDTVKFEVNRTNIVFERLAMKKEILLLGGSELDVAELFRESEYDLQQIKENLLQQETKLSLLEEQLLDKQTRLNQQEHLIGSQTKKLTTAQSQLKRMEQELGNKERLIGEREAEYNKLSVDLGNASNMLKQQQKKLQQGQVQLDSKLSVLEENQQKVNELSELINMNSRVLNQQSAQLEQQKLELSEQDVTIDKQRNWLLYSFAALIVFLPMMVIILFVNQSRKNAIAEMHLLHQKLKISKDEADEANAAKGAFLAKMSHEIRTPMSGVLGMSELLNDYDLSLEQQRCNDIIYTSGSALLNIINDILDYSKIEAGKMNLESLPLHLEMLVWEVVKMFRLRSEEKQLPILVDIDPQLSTFVIGDPTRIRQILINLLSNAFKFTERGEIILQVEKAETGTHNIRFNIQDTGLGISPDQQDKLFSAFSQADSSTSRKYGGTGLGLTICKQLIDLMGGEIGFSSTPNKGSTFWVSLPLPADSLMREEPLMDDDPIRGKTVLLADSNARFCQLFSKTADLWGVKVHIASNNKQALDTLHDLARDGQVADLVICDLKMPDLDGLQLASIIAGEPVFAGTPVVLIAASRNIPDQSTLGKSHVKFVVERPVVKKEFYDLLCKAIADDEHTVQPIQENSSNDYVAEIDTGPDIRILVAEDNQVIQKVMRGLLKKCGQSATFANNGREAVDIVKDNQNPFDVIFMDCEMPEMDGLEATRRIREWEKNRQTPPTQIIALTAHVLQDQAQKCKAAGMDDFMTKPIDFDELNSKIAEALHNTSDSMLIG